MFVMTATASGLRARKKAQQREAIERVAMGLFLSNGFEATTVEVIAAACDISPSTVFRYFSSKEEIVFERAARDGDRLVELLAAQPLEIGPALALHDSLRAMCAEYQDDYVEIARRNEMVQQSPSLRVRRAETQPRWELVVRAEFARRAELPGVPPSDDFTLRIVIATALSAFRVSLEIWMHDPIKSFERIVAEAFQHLARGFDGHE
jgi:AcrR family transcriptional regulator